MKMPLVSEQHSRHAMFVEPGEIVEALRDGELDKDGNPYDHVKKGQRYRIDTMYAAPYGIGCTLRRLDGTVMDNYPYRGYVFRKYSVRDGNPTITHYFKKVD